MNQRDRLAAVLHDAEMCGSDPIAVCYPSSDPRDAAFHVGQADALLARGVRVVDVETLTAAIEVNLKQVRLSGMVVEEPVAVDGVEYWKKTPIAARLAQAVLDTLDKEAMA